MKILMIAPTPFFADRGTHIRILEEARALAKRGHKITIATYHIGREISKEDSEKIDVRRIRRLLFWYKKLEAGPDWQKILLNLLLIRKVFFLVRTQKPDVLWGHLHEGVLIGWFVRRLFFWRKILLLSDFHGSLVGEMRSHGYLSFGFLRGFFRFVEKFINRLGDAAIASSPENAIVISRDRGANVQVVADGVDCARYENLPERQQLRERFGVPEDAFVCVYTGALIENKGVGALFEAIEILSSDPEIHFVIGGAPVENLKSFVSRKNLEKRLTIVHPLHYEDLPEVNLLGDIGIDPKNSEVRQASGKILQYMAAGLPVVCCDRETNRKYCGGGAYYLPTSNSSEIVAAILEAKNDLEECRRRGEVARERSKEFSWDKSAEMAESIIFEKYAKKWSDKKRRSDD